MDTKLRVVKNIYLITLFFIVIFQVYSCKTNQCEDIIEAYNEEWHHEIVKITKSESIRYSYFLETENGENLEIDLPQRVIMRGEIGDSIYKVKKSLFAFVYRNNRFIFITRIASPTCDEFIIKHKVNNGNQGVIPSDLELKMMPKRFLKDSLFKYYMSLKRLSEEEKKNLIFVND